MAPWPITKNFRAGIEFEFELREQRKMGTMVSHKGRIRETLGFFRCLQLRKREVTLSADQPLSPILPFQEGAQYTYRGHGMPGVLLAYISVALEWPCASSSYSG